MLYMIRGPKATKLLFLKGEHNQQQSLRGESEMATNASNFRDLQQDM